MTQKHDFTTFADPSDFCRYCDGTGAVSERTGRGTRCTEPCDMCGGHGVRTIRVSPAHASNAYAATVMRGQG